MGQASNGGIVGVECQQTLLGTHVIFQNRQTTSTYLQLNEIKIFGPDGKLTVIRARPFFYPFQLCFQLEQPKFTIQLLA